jgi:hypothetical protein
LIANITAGAAAVLVPMVQEGGVYYDLEKILVTTNKAIDIFTGGTNNFNVRVESLIGTNASLDLDVRPLINIEPNTVRDNENHIGEVAGKTGSTSAEITTTASQGAYVANDAVLAAAGGVSEITNVARVAGGSGYITGIRLMTNKKSITPRFRVHFFNASNPTVSADNAAWQDKYADGPKRVGYYDMPAMVTAADTTNSDMSRSIDLTVRLPFVCAAGKTSLWFALEALDGFTPDNSQKFTIKLNTELN